MSNADGNAKEQELKKTWYEVFWDNLKSPTFIGLLVFVGALFGVGLLIKSVLERLSAGWGLPILALSSVLLLLGALLVFTTLIHMVGLSDPKSALGLPEGSVRALLALALLGLFAIMASSVLVGTQQREVKGVKLDEISVVEKLNPDAHDIFWKPEPEIVGQPRTFVGTIISTNHIDDFAKQMLTLVGTLMTAVISFYFGSSTLSQTAQGQSGSQPQPTAVSPLTGKKAAAQQYTITGTGLADVTKVEALPENGGTPVVADATATDADAKVTLSLDKGRWTLHVVTASGAQAAVPGVIDIAET